MLMFSIYFLQVRFHALSTVIRIATRGNDQWVTLYRLAYSGDCVTFSNLLDVAGNNAVTILIGQRGRLRYINTWAFLFTSIFMLCFAKGVLFIFGTLYQIQFVCYSNMFQYIIDQIKTYLQTIPANTASYTVEENQRPTPVRALCLRIFPLEWDVYPTLKLEVYGCPSE